MIHLPHFKLFSFGIIAFAATGVSAANFNRDSLRVPESAKFTVTLKEYPGLTSPNPRGWYYKCANVVLAKDGSLIGCWQLSDNHTSLSSNIMVARSKDGGRTWGDYQVIAHSDVWVQQGVWVVPQMSVLRDGRIVIVCDWGQRHPGQGMPMLSDWQKPDRGMSNHLFWSSDNGTTWTKGEKIDDVGGEPGYILELSDGTLAYTRTSSAKTTLLKNPPMPWGDIYYRNEIVFSDDGGKTWPRHNWISENPFQGDCEVGLAEMAPGKLVAATRIGLGNGRFGNPSRLIFSADNGRTWGPAKLAPFYGQRIHLAKLQSGKFLATYRNVWGTPGSRAIIFDPQTDAGFQPNSFILEDQRCELADDVLTIKTDEGQRGAAEFNLYPAQDDRALVDIKATLRITEAELNGVAISAGCWVRFLPDRICLADRPETGFAFDTKSWHTYRILRSDGTIKIFADGKEMLSAPIDSIWVREVRFGNRSNGAGPGQAIREDLYGRNHAVSQWRDLSVKVQNAQDYSIDWQWSAKQGYPDQYRRDHTVVLDTSYAADGGYSSWTQMPDGKIVIVDYTTGGDLESFSWGAVGKGTAPFVRSYIVNESDLLRR